MNTTRPATEPRALLLSSLRGRRRALVALALWSAVQALPALLSGWLVERAVDRGFLRDRLGVGLAWAGTLALVAAAGAWATRQTYRRLAEIVEPLRDELVALACRGSLQSAVASRQDSPAAVARVTQQVEIVREAWTSVLLVVHGFLVVSVGALVGLINLFPLALVLVLPPVVVALVIGGAALPGLAARQRSSIDADEALGGDMSNVARGLRDIVACGGEQTVREQLEARIVASAAATKSLSRRAAMRTSSVAVGGWLPVLLVLVFAPWLRRHGASAGTILGTLTYVATGLHPALQTLARELATSGLWLVVTLRRLLEHADPRPPSVDRVRPPTFPRLERAQDLRLCDVTFRYGPWAEPVVSHLDLVVEDGDHLAIVGASGDGKSTLAALASGLLTPESGTVLLDGVPIERWAADELARRRALIPQEAYVFSGTLHENLTYLCPGAPARRIDAASMRLGLDALMSRVGLHEPLDTTALSAGERQLITLVRAYLSPAPLVILDEASCHLDQAAEARVERAFSERPGTLLVIAHRMSSAFRARQVLVLDGARASLGTHQQLMTESALYRDLAAGWQTGTPVAP